MNKAKTVGITNHPLRTILSNEAHARPYAQLTAPVYASHLAILSDETVSGETTTELEIEHLKTLCEFFKIPLPEQIGRHFSADLGVFRIKWERHSEFSTYTFFIDGDIEHAFETTAIEQVPSDWLKQLPGELLMAAHIALLPCDKESCDIHSIGSLFSGNTVSGSTVTSGAARVWTDFQIHPDGFSRFLIQDINMHNRQAGRLLQRLYEIEQYRMLALLSFPLAQKYTPDIKRLDLELTRLTAAITHASNLEDEHRILEQLTRLSAELEQIVSATSYRFSAARAYYDIIHQRLEDMREERIQGVQTLHEFMQRRLAPAMQTCRSVEGRLQSLARRLARTNTLLRAKVDISMEGQSRDLLHSMDRRAYLQLRMQETVEGLSVVILSYYLVGLVSYGLKALKASGIGINVELGTGIAIPIVITTVFFGVRHLKRLAGHDGE